MKFPHSFLPRLLPSVVVAAALSAAGMSGAQAASITCGDLTLGLRTTTVDPALAGGLCYAGLTNLGDGALVTLLNTLIAPDTSTLVDRDTGNNNGGLLNITGVGGASGTWTFAPSVWDYERVFLYFHFGDGQDNPLPNGGAFDPTVDPDIFIVELKEPDITGDWSFGGGNINGLSNIGLLRSNTRDTPDDPSAVPEPGVLLLLGAGLLGLGMARRRKSV